MIKWILTLIAAGFVASLALGAVSGVWSSVASLNFGFVIGYSIPNMAIILIPSGLIALVTRFFTGNATTAMWTWTIITLVIVAILFIGAVNVNRIMSL